MLDGFEGGRIDRGQHIGGAEQRGAIRRDFRAGSFVIFIARAGVAARAAFDGNPRLQGGEFLDRVRHERNARFSGLRFFEDDDLHSGSFGERFGQSSARRLPADRRRRELRHCIRRRLEV